MVSPAVVIDGSDSITGFDWQRLAELRRCDLMKE